MRPHFSPQRQGAKYILDNRDIVIAQGTPKMVSSGVVSDTRIRISRNGFAERATWVRLPKRHDSVGLSTEFHLWTYNVDASTLTRVEDLLRLLSRLDSGAERDPGMPVRVLRFWRAGVRTLAYEDGSLSSDDARAFDLAWGAIASAVPARQAILGQKRTD